MLIFRHWQTGQLRRLLSALIFPWALCGAFGVSAQDAAYHADEPDDPPEPVDWEHHAGAHKDSKQIELAYLGSEIEPQQVETMVGGKEGKMLDEEEGKLGYRRLVYNIHTRDQTSKSALQLLWA